MQIELTINGKLKSLEIHPGESLLETLRKNGYTGVKYGCGTGDCGACVVLLNEKPVNSCQVLTAAVDGESVTTVEGIGTMDKPHPIQEELVKAGAVQCGYCTPGVVLSAYALLQTNPHPTEDEIKTALDGHLCRCTGYVKIIEGVKNAAEKV
ncbi:MAG: (2Fe-2S)-binding protein [Candidatus Marinimicrobia bacterium]|jgi:aerobic-type carbon monoxide dehydrogenase small subunit (CoxS/CutS family)|nr:(2Fe-2S)-binding protein [Candidatus Neomarinimicrobiota bacterium]MCK9484637.1 (2Fe-2S)-binding protein [Candidatus Neomarinimicrobiota bacterium]MCK9560737.1 (2Fe-2S)-binding protein [Candidatus Neomarinimicrobiota bacterium]MDD5230925.1 (2Fe-2S)-binding protein [Candidatus Neomarinimicrobiota bacterium]